MKTMRSQCAIQDIKIMRRNHDEASLPAEQAAANALLGLALADEMMVNVSVQKQVSAVYIIIYVKTLRCWP